MPFSVRKSFAVLLWISVAMLVALQVGYRMSPAGVFAPAARVSDWGPPVLWSLSVLAVLVALAWPPVIPALRVRFGEFWRRLGSDRAPLYDGLSRLRHLETHDDRLRVGRAARQLGEFGLAFENLNRAVELDPQHVGSRFQLGALAVDLGHLPQAVELLHSVVRDDEQHAFGDALFLLGRCLFRLHESRAAIPVLRRHQQLFPGSRQTHLLLARALADTGDLPAARVELAAAKAPPSDNRRLEPREALARAQARVTVLRSGQTPTETGTGAA